MAQDVKDRVMQRAGGSGQSKSLAQQIKEMEPQLARALPAHMSAERMSRIALTEFRKNPQLGRCDPGSFFGSLLTASQLGLEPGPLGHCYLIPYGNTVTLILGYRGMLDLVQRSDKVDSVYAYPVYEGDEFDYNLGVKPDIHHRPLSVAAAGAAERLQGEDRKLTHVYAVAHIKGSSIPRIEVMTRKEVDAIRERSAGAKKKGGPWDTDYPEMAKKTVLKRICKTLPLSVEIQSHLSRDETVRKDVTVDINDAESIFDSLPEEKIEGPKEEVEEGPK